MIVELEGEQKREDEQRMASNAPRQASLIRPQHTPYQHDAGVTATPS